MKYSQVFQFRNEQKTNKRKKNNKVKKKKKKSLKQFENRLFLQSERKTERKPIKIIQFKCGKWRKWDRDGYKHKIAYNVECCGTECTATSDKYAQQLYSNSIYILFKFIDLVCIFATKAAKAASAKARFSVRTSA